MKVLLTALAVSLGFVLLTDSPGLAQPPGEKESIVILQPNRSGGKSLMAAINERHSAREFKMEPLTEQQVADLLWVAVGVNRPEGNLRTTPTAMNRQDVSVYALTESGAYYYDAIEHRLDVISSGDMTSYLGAPFAMVFVAPVDNPNAGINVGYCSQNIYLYAASEGLNTVAKVTFDRQTIKKLLKISDKQQLVLAQPVGPRP